MKYFVIFINDNIFMYYRPLKLIKYLIAGFSLIFSIGINAQQADFKHTMIYDSITGSPKAEITDLDWIQGDWRGSAFGGKTEETWNVSSGGSLMGMFKLYDENGVYFYELMIISEEESTLMMRLKHFNADLSGWEAKEESVIFKLVKLEKQFAFFDGLTFENVSNNEMNVYVVIENNDGKKEEHLFQYIRKK